MGDRAAADETFPDGLDGLADPVFRVSAAGILTRVNCAGRGLAPEGTGRPFTALVATEDRQAAASALRFGVAVDLRFAACPERWWWMRPAVDGGGVTVLAIDVTHRRSSEHQSGQQAVDRVLTALDEINDAFVIYDRDGRLVVCNRRFRDLYGYSEAEARRGVHFRELGRLDVERGNVMIGDGEGTEGYLDRKAEYRRRLTGVFDVHLKDGRWIQTRDRRLPDGGFVSIQTDVTESRRAAEDLVTARDDAERALADTRATKDQLEQFAYVASHDLREPLRMVTSYLDLLERRFGARLDGDGLEFLEHARGGARRMDALILDLLAYTRVGRSGVEDRVVDSARLLQMVRANLTLALEESRAVLVLPKAPPPVFGCHPELVSLFQNLIGNALKYRHPDRRPKVTVAVEVADGRTHFSVMDNGIGIEARYHDRIFQIFQRLHPRDVYPGTGMGLALCRKIVERHGGRLGLTSEPDVGSAFTFDLAPAPGGSAGEI